MFFLDGLIGVGMSKSLSKKILKTFYLLSERTKAFIGQEDIVFILYDSGESNALIPVLEILEECGLNFHILSFATSSRLVKDYKHKIICLSDEIGDGPFSSDWLREEGLSEGDLESVLKSLNTNYVITGMVSEIQRQISESLKKRGTFVVGYYDSFAGMNPNHITFSFLPFLDEVLVPSEAIGASIKGLFPELRVLVVGQPSIETWRKMIREGRSPEKKSDFEKDSRFTIAYVGGYGEDYAEAFELFLDSIEGEKECRVVVSLHPKVDGKFERELLSQRAYPHVEILSKNTSTNYVVLQSDLVVTHRSTVGVQAIFVEKPVIFFDVPESRFSNVAIENGWAQKVVTKDEFLKVLEAGIEDTFSRSKDIFRQGGIPEKASMLIFNSIQSKARSRIFQVLQNPSEQSKAVSQIVASSEKKEARFLRNIKNLFSQEGDAAE